ncbi:putative ATP-dependent endonuclease of OLD family [Tenacibaculum skagerrakense]|uniref:Putative ATP-dependent endonuclease of OLD family n=1 Tax=Tenacibaculum skagerrakense TaxID=186571 RepID=A0A4R2NT46_9FLAO|nr:AAA family ATPase [Tenacibaculum skagerrakense]TCP25143.1 putative ATP-dependent endonuclease of OLD family [Tenacibaculum skagerrakense]
MRIISFGVNNFRGISGGIENNTIEFKDSNTIFLIGQNNVGKSSFLKAYDFFYKNISVTPEDIFRIDPENQIEFELVLQLDEFDFKKEAIKNKKEGLKKWLNEDNLLRIRKVIKPKAGKKITFEKTENLTWDFENEKWEKKNYGGIGLDSVFQAALPTPIFIKAMPTESEVELIINEILKQKAKLKLEDKERQELKEAQEKIQELQDKIYNPESISSYKEEVNKNFQELFPNTKIELEEKDKIKWTENSIGKSFSIHFEKNNENGEKDESIPTNYDKIGHGAVRSAIFSLLLMKDIAEEFERVENRKDYIVLFEEPELFLHPKLMKQLRSLIYKVSETESPYQIICASHSPQMIDITKEKSSLVRMVKSNSETRLYQINDEFLKQSKKVQTKDELKQEMNEVLRFNPFICESFYADEVVLVEGPTEEIILRGYLTETNPNKDLFIVNCGTVNNIPFYQKVFSKFSIKYHVICDTDASVQNGNDENGLPIFDSGIQKTIYTQFSSDYIKENYETGLFLLHRTTFEPAHQDVNVNEDLRYPDDYNVSDGKPYNANLYWKNKLQPNLDRKEILSVPIIKYIRDIINL